MSFGVPASIGYVPGGITFANMRKRVLRYVHGVQDDAELDELAGDEINDGIQKINSRVWHKIINYQDITIDTSNADYSLNSDVSEPLHLHRYNSDGNPDGFLNFLGYKSFETEFPQSIATGTPDTYTLFPDRTRVLTLNYIPNASFVASYPTLRFRYHRRVDYLVGAAQTTGLFPEFDRFLIWHARAGVAAVRAPEMYGLAESRAQESWDALVAKDARFDCDWSDFDV